MSIRTTTHRRMHRRTYLTRMVKKPELLFSTIIVLVMVFIGIWISSAISESVMQTSEEYSTATIISDPSQFDYAAATNFGNALLYGEVESDELTTFDEIGNGYIYIEKVREEYTRHTRTVTKTDSNGNKRTETEVYYSWDYDGKTCKHVDSITFLGKEFPFGYIDLPTYRLDLFEAGVQSQRSNYIYTRSDIRYYYNVTPNNLTGTVFASLNNSTVEDPSALYHNMTPQEVIESVKKSETTAQVIFWIVWTAAIIFIVYKFVEQENYWLD